MDKQREKTSANITTISSTISYYTNKKIVYFLEPIRQREEEINDTNFINNNREIDDSAIKNNTDNKKMCQFVRVESKTIRTTATNQKQ